MTTFDLPESLTDTIEHTIGGIVATRFLSGTLFHECGRQIVCLTRHIASAVTLALWDHAVTAGNEVDTIWSRNLDLTKVIYLVNRWGVSMGLIYAAYGTSHFL